ncbi:hypothetical protein DMENIID0001_119050 [Sergentomyia squamirostris]
MKKKGEIFSCFFDDPDDNSQKICKYCKRPSGKGNATRLKAHISDCSFAPQQLKDKATRELSLLKSRQKKFEEQRMKNPQKISKLTKKNKKSLEDALTLAIITSNSPFSFVENQYFKDFVHQLNPDFKMPSRRKIGGKHVDDKYTNVRKICEERINASPTLGIMADTWTNIRGEGMMNIIITTPQPYFVRSLNLGVESKTAEFIRSLLDEDIQEYGPEKFMSVVMDNEKANVTAWELMERKYPHIDGYGCACHFLNLITGDLAKIPKVKRIMTKVQDIAKTINNCRFLKCDLMKESTRTLKLTVKTRWLSHTEAFHALICNKNYLLPMAMNNSRMPSDIAETILDRQFWENVIALHGILASISEEIQRLEVDPLNGEDTKISYVISSFQRVHETIQAIGTQHPFFNAKKAMLKAYKKRYKHHLRPIHFAANYLHPKLRGDNLSTSEREIARKHIMAKSEHLNLNATEIADDLFDFRLRRGAFKHSQHENKPPLTWWYYYFDNTDICKVATVILKSPATSSAVERSFSAQKLIHTQQRNRLDNSKVDKLLYVKHNLRWCPKMSPEEDDGSDNESDDSERDVSTLEIESNDEGEEYDVQLQEASVREKDDISENESDDSERDVSTLEIESNDEGEEYDVQLQEAFVREKDDISENESDDSERDINNDAEEEYDAHQLQDASVREKDPKLVCEPEVIWNTEMINETDESNGFEQSYDPLLSNCSPKVNVALEENNETMQSTSEEKTLHSMPIEELLKTFDEMQEILDPSIKTFIHNCEKGANPPKLKDFLFTMCYSIASDQQIVACLNFLQSLYKDHDDFVTYNTKWLLEYLIPEWLLLVFMKKMKISRVTAIQRMEGL